MSNKSICRGGCGGGHDNGRRGDHGRLVDRGGQYAEEKLELSPDADKAARDRYAGYYAAALQRWQMEITGPRQKAALAEMDLEIDNIRAAWHWMVGRGQAARLNQAADGLGRYIDWRKRHVEGEFLYRVAAQALSVPGTGMSSGTADRLRALRCPSFEVCEGADVCFLWGHV